MLAHSDPRHALWHNPTKGIGSLTRAGLVAITSDERIEETKEMDVSAGFLLSSGIPGQDADMQIVAPNLTANGMTKNGSAYRYKWQ